MRAQDKLTVPKKKKTKTRLLFHLEHDRPWTPTGKIHLPNGKTAACLNSTSKTYIGTARGDKPITIECGLGFHK